ncbi:SDR family oxidoreductase [Geobacter sp.]|uniref:SDR family oxidoreductase n=1 Tax=Geobacter sp. TaxID=46610 RepID=UPI0026215332|nr:SDR family oxidoreductase [Geobacter sp.]
MVIKDNIFVVTGAARGLGFAFARNLTEAGGRVAMVDLNAEVLEKAAESLRDQGAEVRFYVANVTSEGEVTTLFDNVEKDFGGIDGLINNAGITRDSMLVKRKGDGLEMMTKSDWQQVIDVNLTGVFLCGREAAARMVRANRQGVIVNISSICRNGNIGQSNYSAAKAGVAALTSTWGKELCRYGIRVGAIAPGYVNTEMVQKIRPEVLEMLKSKVPLGRLAEPEEIAHTARYIIENDYFTSRTISVDGGFRL